MTNMTELTISDTSRCRGRRLWLFIGVLAAVGLLIVSFTTQLRWARVGTPLSIVPVSQHSRSQYEDSLKGKRMWTAGWNARTFPANALDSGPPPVLRWSRGAVATFRAHWHAIQTDKAVGGGIPGGKCHKSVRLIPPRDYGLMSYVRDVGTSLFEQSANGVPSRLWPEALKHSPRPFCLASTLDGDTATGCFWVQPLANCTVDQDEGLPGLTTSSLIGNVVPPFWASMVLNGYVWWETPTGERLSPAPVAFRSDLSGLASWLPFLFGPTQGPIEWSVHSMARSLMFETAWVETDDVRKSIVALENTLEIKQPMLTIQIRRTDKIEDNGIVSFRAHFPSGNVPLSEYGEMVRLVENELDISFKSVLLLTDDLDSWTSRSEWLAGFRDESVVPLLNPFWLKYETLFASPEWHKKGHANLKLNVEPTMYSFHRELVADMMLAVRHGSYLIGCGSSGVSQFVAQGLGYRYMTESSWLSYFEEDHFAANL